MTLSEYRLFAQRIGLIGVTNLLVSLSGVILLPILTKNLPVEEYGVYAQIIVTIGLIPSIVLLGLPYTMVRFLAGEKDRETVREGFYSIYFIVIFMGAITSLALFLSSDLIASILFDDNQTVVKILSMIIFVECLNSLQYNYFRTFQHMKRYSSFIFMQTILNILLIAYFVLSGYGITGVAIGILIARISMFIIMAVPIVAEIGVKMPRFEKTREYLAFGLPTVPGSLSSWLINSSDRYIIGILMGAAFVGYYSPGYTLGYMISMFIAPLGLILPATLSRYYDSNDKATAGDFLKYSLKYFLLLAIPSAFGLSLLSKPLLTILSTPEIAEEGYLITPLVAFGTVFFGASVIITHIIIMEKKTAIMGSLYTVAAVLNLSMNLALIPLIGIVGAAASTLLAYILIFFVGTYYSFRYLKFDLNIRFILKSIFASIIMSLIILRWYPEGVSSLIIVIAVCVLVYAGVLLLLKGMTKEEISFFKMSVNIK
ncbi:flippase [Candidatus Methanocrinis natronophilus]|uniref:Flippase n=1 Tax=Candidatus Methanocrinis natronophilus TaxID=3033396 RepID=A0ABT5X9M4_9EURY|nr:flippase [Candidatus Methanocrinis natronophilus]MDF0591408.1 flippase [Candidatus Methanocrinis natronophilus]